MTALRVVVDGEGMKDADAIAMWQRFSAYMDEHKGDLAGFAKQEGFSSIHPAMEKGMPVLVASRTGSQKPYASVKEEATKPGGGKGGKPGGGGGGRGGSSGHQGTPRDPAGGKGSPKAAGGKPGKRR